MRAGQHCAAQTAHSIAIQRRKPISELQIALQSGTGARDGFSA
jgi:hypothetical protein